MSSSVKNVLNSFAYDKVNKIIENNKYVTSRMLDNWEVELHGVMKENDQKIGKKRIRELVVAYLLSEFGVKAFGVKPMVELNAEISDSYIRKMKNQRKKGFRDMKIMKIN